MSSAPAAAPSARPAKTTPAIIILGADALLAVRPATYGQLANACYAAGYNVVIPGSWGDELVAAGCLREIAARGQGTVVLCSCPRVAEPMRRAGSLASYLLPMVPSPVAAARYLRARAGVTGVHITYVGECPGAADPSIDRHATPAALLRSLAKRSIYPADQPAEVEERLVRDGRRFYSLPGGAPAPNWLYAEKRGYTLLEPTARDYLAEIAHLVADKERRVIDLAPRVGCACSGAVVGEPWTQARETVAALEPPRAVHEVLDHDVPLSLDATIEPWTGSADDGQRTVSIPLAELAAMYDPQTKAEPVRASAPPPLPRRSRPTARVSGEPVSAGSASRAPEPASGGHAPPPADRPTGAPAPAPDAVPAAGPFRRADDPAEQSSYAPADPRADPRADVARMALAGLRAEFDSRAAATVRETRFAPPSHVPTGTPAVGTGGSTVPMGPAPMLLAESTTDDPRVGPDADGAASATPLAAQSHRAERRTLVITACGVVALAACAFLMMRVFAARPSRSATTSTTRATPGSAGPAPNGAPAVEVPDTAGATPLAASPALPRLPVGPAARVDAPMRPRPAGPQSEDTTLFSPHFRANPAPVFTPGAAPVPRSDVPTAAVVRPVAAPLSPAAAAAAHKAGAAFRNALTPQAAAEMAAVRAAIIQRQQHADSVRKDR